MMKQQDITTGFQNVDNAHGEFLVKFLDDVNQYTTVQDCFKSQLDLLKIRHGDQILDIGCGIGDQAFEMAKIVGISGSVVGTDLSETMVQASKKRHTSTGLQLNFEKADVTKQPFKNETFDIVRTERVLMYVRDVYGAFHEYYRLLKPGGKLLVFDFDWDALTIAHPDKILTRKIIEFISDSFPNGRIGSQLPGLFANFGFENIRTKAIGYVTPLEFSKRAYEAIIASGISKGVFNGSEISEWWLHIEEADRKGSFLNSFNGFIVTGTKLCSNR